MPITRNSGRQNALRAYVPFTYVDFVSGVAQLAAELPGDTIVTGGELVITTAWNSATSDTMKVGDGVVTDRYKASINAAAVARTALVPTGFRNTEKDTVDITWTGAGAAPTQGAGFLSVEYIAINRATETSY